MARGITESDVFTACDALLLAGERPTIERVRQTIGRGSPNTVSPMLDAWFKGLGRRLQDPGAFAAPPDVPEPILQAAQHFWEVALSLARSDIDRRVHDGLAASAAELAAEKEAAAAAVASAAELGIHVARLQSELAEQGALLDEVRQSLAAEGARVVELRSALSSADERLCQQEERSNAALAELKRHLAAALDRADAADRRVALELERERTTRAKVERQADSLLKRLDAMLHEITAAEDRTRQQISEGRHRETTLSSQLSAVTAELNVERERVVELSALRDASVADAAAARTQILGLQASLDRLTTFVTMRSPQARTRTSKPQQGTHR